MKFWVNVRSVITEPRMKRLTKGDRVAFYSPYPEQRFTAIGEITGDGQPQIELRPAIDAPLQPLIESLDFIRDKKQWGWVFRRGFFEVSESDFRKIEESSLPAAVQ